MLNLIDLGQIPPFPDCSEGNGSEIHPICSPNTAGEAQKLPRCYHNQSPELVTQLLSAMPQEAFPPKPLHRAGQQPGFSGVLPALSAPGAEPWHTTLTLPSPRVPELPKPSSQPSLSLGPWRSPRCVPCHIHSTLPTPSKAALKSQSCVHPAGSRGCARILELLWAHSSTALLLVSTVIPEPSQRLTFLGRQCCCCPSFQSLVLVACPMIWMKSVQTLYTFPQLETSPHLDSPGASGAKCEKHQHPSPLEGLQEQSQVPSELCPTWDIAASVQQQPELSVLHPLRAPCSCLVTLGPGEVALQGQGCHKASLMH